MTPPLLTIRSVRSTPVDVPMARPLGTSAQSIRSAPLLLIDLETEEGVTGRSYLFCYVGMAAAAIARVLDDAIEGIAGDRLAPLDVAAKLARRYRLIGVQGIVRMALAGLDVALWDALSIAAGLPLVSFLGGSPRPIPASPRHCAGSATERRRRSTPHVSPGACPMRRRCADGSKSGCGRRWGRSRWRSTRCCAHRLSPNAR